jgi:hypothetical protein
MAKRLFQAALGVSVGLALPEGAFCLRDKGAFPHLNVYEADPNLGARLRPGATERISFNDNPVTHVRINAQGFRGDAFPAPAPREVIVVGDSQVFGLGVEEGERFSEVLGAELGGRTVLNAGVPTYGPPEYEAVIDRLTRERTAADPDAPRTVLYVVNLANDLFEAARPNVARHAVWDGWAVRIETAPPKVRAFPGRELLYRDSHAFYALRGYLLGDLPQVALPSEGTWADLVTSAKVADADAKDAKKKEGDARQARRDMADQLAQERADAQRALEDNAPAGMSPYEMEAEYKRTHGEPGDTIVSRVLTDAEAHAWPLQRHGPRDIVRHEWLQGEEGRWPAVVAYELIKGAEVRRQVEAAYRVYVGYAAKPGSYNEAGAKIMVDALAKRADVDAKLAALAAAAPPVFEPPSPMRAPLERVKKICDERHARLVVVVLPLDVQVSSDEWKKYGTAPIDMSPTQILNDDILRVAASLGIPAWSVLDMLRTAEPGAFLRGDLHMSPKGHRAVGVEIAKRLRALEADAAR